MLKLMKLLVNRVTRLFLPTYSCVPIDSICPTSSSFRIHTPTCTIDNTSSTPLSYHSRPIISSYLLSPILDIHCSPSRLLRHDPSLLKLLPSPNHPPPTTYSLPVLRKTSLISLHANSICRGNVQMGEGEHMALSHTKTCVFVLYNKATKAVLQLLHANMHMLSCVGHY